MIPWNKFLALVANVLNRQIDPAQQDAIKANVSQSLFIIAGPGSGKTTVLTLRVLKLIFVDDVDPAAILATTFTRKAAAELRSRILGWGDQVRQALLSDLSNTLQCRDQWKRLDFNKVVTGTLDSIAEQVLTDFRAPGTQPPVLLEEFVAKAMMLRNGLWKERRHLNQDFQDYVWQLNRQLSAQKDKMSCSHRSSPSRRRQSPTQKDKIDICYEVRNRFVHDCIDVDAFENAEAAQCPGVTVLCQIIRDYVSGLDLEMDFAALEQEFLNRLDDGSLDRFVQELRVILVDEYQDTNLLQEQIYFTLARKVHGRGGSITVVGDDDQSLYRFRGATVELFSEFKQRLQKQCGIQAKPIYLSNNYRSTRKIVSLYNKFIQLDPEYVRIRVPDKPRLTAARSGSFMEYPILGMFRPDVETLARDLSKFISDVFNGNGVIVSDGTQQFRIIKNPNGGAVGDCVLLCSSPREYSSGGKPRLPLLMRKELAGLPNPIQVFNPRGQEFSKIKEVQQLCGLMLECIDPDARIQKSIPNFPGSIPKVFEQWREVARQYIASNPPAPGSTKTSTNTLENFVRAWQQRTPQGSGSWPREVPLMQLLYKLITWIPTFQEDPEGLVYLEVITRTITQSARFIDNNVTIQGEQPRADRSVKAILWNIFEPLASGAIDIDEELIELLPRDRLNIMSIHQAKGLEFPLVIVDVGSDFKRKHRMQAFKRFPRGESRAHKLEDILRRYPLLDDRGLPKRSKRSAIDRAFDDLVRRYFVAFSRPQDVLMLVGLGDKRPKDIPNVATWWTRDKQWHWQDLPETEIVYL